MDSQASQQGTSFNRLTYEGAVFGVRGRLASNRPSGVPNEKVDRRQAAPERCGKVSVSIKGQGSDRSSQGLVDSTAGTDSRLDVKVTTSGRHSTGIP